MQVFKHNELADCYNKEVYCINRLNGWKINDLNFGENIDVVNCILSQSIFHTICKQKRNVTHMGN